MTKYVVLTANNADTDICIDGPYETKFEAQVTMEDSFDCFDESEGEWERSEDSISYYDGSDLYYAVVKPIQV